MQFNKPTDLLYTNDQTIVTALGEFLTSADDERKNRGNLEQTTINQYFNKKTKNIKKNEKRKEK